MLSGKFCILGENQHYYFILFLKDFIYLFLEKGKEGEGEKHHCVFFSCMPPHWGPGPHRRYVP